MNSNKVFTIGMFVVLILSFTSFVTTQVLKYNQINENKRIVKVVKTNKSLIWNYFSTNGKNIEVKSYTIDYQNIKVDKNNDIEVSGIINNDETLSFTAKIAKKNNHYYFKESKNSSQLNHFLHDK